MMTISGLDETLFSAPIEDVLAQLKANNLQGKTIVLSAAPSVDAVNRFSQSGVHHLALKPYTTSELTALA